jgi:hypothetical protein
MDFPNHIAPAIAPSPKKSAIHGSHKDPAPATLAKNETELPGLRLLRKTLGQSLKTVRENAAEKRLVPCDKLNLKLSLFFRCYCHCLCVTAGMNESWAIIMSPMCVSLFFSSQYADL